MNFIWFPVCVCSLFNAWFLNIKKKWKKKYMSFERYRFDKKATKLKQKPKRVKKKKIVLFARK